jgi:epoxide hydrolase-like predicted phosphatase
LLGRAFSDWPMKAVVFDIGGVLNIAPRISDFLVFRHWEDKLGLDPGQITHRARSAWESGRTGTITEEEFHSRLSQSLGWDDLQTRAFMADFWREYRGTPNAELIQYFTSLRPRCRTALLSNSFVGAREEQQDLSEITDLIVYSHEVGISKPDRRVYEIVDELLGVGPNQTFFLDDSEPYVAAARAVGMHGVLFHNNSQAITEIEAWLDR